MKVKLATQLLSRSVADAFEDVDANTWQNLYIYNDWGFKKAVCPENVASISAFATQFTVYVINVKRLNLKTMRKIGFH